MVSTLAFSPVFAAGDIVLAEIPFSQSRHEFKPRPAFVVRIEGNCVTVRGVYSKPRPGRKLIRVTSSNGLGHDSFMDSETTRIPRHRVIKPLGETPVDFDPFDDFLSL